MNIGDNGTQCPKCKSHSVTHHTNHETLDEWYECEECYVTGDKYDFACTSLPVPVL